MHCAYYANTVIVCRVHVTLIPHDTGCNSRSYGIVSKADDNTCDTPTSICMCIRKLRLIYTLLFYHYTAKITS